MAKTKTWYYMAHELPPVGKPILLMSVQYGSIPKYMAVAKWTDDDSQIRLRYRKNNEYCYWMIVPRLNLNERDDPIAREQKDAVKKAFFEDELTHYRDPFGDE